MKEYILTPIMTRPTLNLTPPLDKPAVVRTVPPRQPLPTAVIDPAKPLLKLGLDVQGQARPRPAPPKAWGTPGGGPAGGRRTETSGNSGRVQQRMEWTFGAITLSSQATPSPRLSPFRSFGD